MSLTKSFGVIAMGALFAANIASAQTTGLSGTVVSPSSGVQYTGTAASAATTYNAINTGVRVVQVSIRDNVFNPHNVVVPTGSTVTWSNNGSTTHTVIADRGAFNSGPIPAGGTFSHVFDTNGTYVYYDPAFGSAGGQGMFGIIVVMNSADIPSGGAVLGDTTGVPNLPNTGDGGMGVINLILLALSGIVMVGGALVLRERFFSERGHGASPYFFA